MVPLGSFSVLLSPLLLSLVHLLLPLLVPGAAATAGGGGLAWVDAARDGLGKGQVKGCGVGSGMEEEVIDLFEELLAIKEV